MAIVDDFTSATNARVAGRGHWRELRAGWKAFFTAIAAGWRASADYHQLSEMSDRQLKLRGLSRSDIPRELHQRHFASLRGWLDAID